MFGVRSRTAIKTVHGILKDLTSKPCTAVKRHCGGGEAFAPEAVLGAASRERCVRALKRLQPVRVDGAKAPRKAAVLVPLCVVDGTVALLYTLRAASMPSYRGQVSFPGGMLAACDGGSVEAAALREAREELGVEAGAVRVWGAGPWVATGRRDAVVQPVVASLGCVQVGALRCCPREVECAFALPLHALCQPHHFRYTRFRNSYILPVFTAGEYRIWGLTAIITHMLLKALLPTVYSQQLPRVKHSLQLE